MDGIGWAASAVSAARARLDIAAENLANASTDGFRGKRAHGFLDALGAHVRAFASVTQGALRPTGRRLDFALVGRGAFRVRDSAGRVHATRDGAFVRDRFGRLTDERGRILLGAHGPLRFPHGAQLRANGDIVRGGRIIDRLGLPAGGTVRTGFLESSNVGSIGEMIDMLSAQRSFESAEKVLSEIDSTRERAATQVAALK